MVLYSINHLALYVALCTEVVGPVGSEPEHFSGQNQIQKTTVITQFPGFQNKTVFPTSVLCQYAKWRQMWITLQHPLPNHDLLAGLSE